MKKYSFLACLLTMYAAVNAQESFTTDNNELYPTPFVVSQMFPAQTYFKFTDTTSFLQEIVVQHQHSKPDNIQQTQNTSYTDKQTKNVPSASELSHYRVQKDAFMQTDDASRITEHLDSMLESWYIRNAIAMYDSTSIYPDTLKTFEYLSDSVYAARLAAIPSIFDLSYNEKVRAFIEMYVYKIRKNSSLILGLSEYYFPMFDQIFDSYGVPLELKHLAIIESALNPRARSRAGATGLWQFMYGTGRMYKLEINSLVDERCDPINETHAAVRYLRDMYEVYGDWTLVIAAYNCGPGYVNRAIKRAGGKTNYWEIYDYLPRETRGYVPAFIAATYLVNYHKQHGIVPVKMDMPVWVDTVNVTQKLHLMQVAEVLQMNIDQLRDLNPQYKKDIVPATGRNYALILPSYAAQKFVELEDSIYNYKDQIFEVEKYNTTIVASASSDNDGVSAPSTVGKSPVTYTVQNGDNLGYIATWFNTSIANIKYWNNFYNRYLRVGDKLTIYVPTGEVAKYEAVNNMTFDQKQATVPQTNTYVSNTKTSVGSKNITDDGQYIYYTVRSGDNLWSIAQQFQGVTNTDIMALNNMTADDARRLMPGDVLKIKKKS